MAILTSEASRKSTVEEGFATALQAGAYLGLSRAKIYLLMESGDLKYAKFGKSRRIPWRALRAYAEGCMVTG